MSHHADKPHRPRLSAFVPAYNYEKYIGQTLRSIFAQTHPPDELLVIDDGSKDGSAKVIEGALKDCPFPSEFISRPNKGLSATLNEGLAKTNGDYFAYLGADDIWLPEFIKERIRLLESRPEAVLAYGHAYAVDGETRIFESTADGDTYTGGAATLLLERALAPVSSTVCYRRSILERYGWNENSRLEDFELYLYLVREGPFAFDPQVLSVWRMHGNNASRDTRWMLDECLAAHRRVAEKVGQPESSLKRAEAKTSLEYAVLLARNGHKRLPISLLVRNWLTAPDLSKPVKIIGHCILPPGLKRARSARRNQAAVERFRAIEATFPK
jgi:alpha-1,3-rhamnosyltransferase